MPAVFSKVGTWVEGPAGKCHFVLEEGVDGPGLYILIFKQWEYHGAEITPETFNRIPIIRNWGDLKEEQLLRLVAEHMRAYNCAAFCVYENPTIHRKLNELFQADIAGIGNDGDVTPGLPNSRKFGISRASGIARGQGSCYIRANRVVHYLWDMCCIATGRPPVFKVDGVNFVAPPDGVLFTRDVHGFRGAKRHRDWEPDQCGCLQGLGYVFPARPAGVWRVGTGFSFYRAHPELVKRMEVLALCGWSSSPDCDFRTSPMPSLGSHGKAPAGGWSIIGGPCISKAEALAMTASQRAKHISKLPQHVRSLLPRVAMTSVPETVDWLIQCKFQPLSGKAVKAAYDRMPTDDPAAKRRLFLQAMAGGLAPGGSEARNFWAPGTKGILTTGPEVIRNSILFQDPGKLHRWLEDGGQRSHVGIDNLQPSGRVGFRRKQVGSVKATKGAGIGKKKSHRSGKK